MFSEGDKANAVSQSPASGCLGFRVSARELGYKDLTADGPLEGGCRDYKGICKVLVQDFQDCV